MSPAREAQIQKGLVTSHQVYNMISRQPGLSVYQYAKLLHFTHGRTEAAVKRLEDNGLVKTELRAGNPHAKRIVVPVPAADLIRRFNKLDP